MSHRPAFATTLVVLGVLVLLALAEGIRPLGQTTVNGLVSASYYALGAVGLTLVYGILRIVNFAHGDFLTFGAYMALWVNVALGLPILAAVLFAMMATAAIGVFLELGLWRPLRGKRAGVLQLILVSIGLAFLLRNGIQFVAGSAQRRLDVDVTTAIEFLGLRIGRTQLIVVVVGFAVLLLVGAMLRTPRWVSRCARCRTTATWPRPPAWTRIGSSS